MQIRALSVRQPFPELIAEGLKTLEIRSRATHYRGPLLIIAGGQWHKEGKAFWGRLGLRGVAVCIVDLVDCRPVTENDSDAACVDCAGVEGFAWVLANPRRVEPVPMKGQLSMFTPEVVPPLSAA